MKRPSGQLRIIGGEWRSRRVAFDPESGVRPTPDRVRQTVFDWLTPYIDGARCLDLFAGSGALGFEALSRGAASLTLVEKGARQATALRTAVHQLQAGDRAQVVAADALAYLGQPHGPYDIVFVDPPYDAALLSPVLAALEPRLAAVHRVYCEWRESAAPAWPPGWCVIKEKQAGQVSYALTSFSRG